MSSIRMRVRGPSATVTLEAAADWTLAQLLELIRDKTGVQSFTLKTGFPPTPLDLADAAAMTLGPLQLNGATIMLVPTDSGGPSASESAPAPTSSTPAPPPFVPKGVDVDETVVPWDEGGGYLVLRVMPDDNSCMFTAFGGVVGIPDPAVEVRARVAEHILAHPDKYSKVVLENKEPAEYARWVRDPQRWGGSIELQCLSEIYDIQICSIDVKYGRVDTYGLDKDTRCILLYSGIHYDRIAQTFDLGLPVDMDVTKWGTDDEAVLAKAKELAAKLKGARYYTDTQTMAIRCEVPGCENWLGSGQKDMIKHTKETGHTAFSELAID
ncbi:otu-like cysteine peptidase [Grosmannia clavigera kw1407]|uniref:Ubiquitin thioesterase OTU n=1 Tax=Grosmannia clavigera (strain kw1407 / UAMH 11150) TaxID=655863 RepID=F0X8W9_GROCL|nr:otu-like cysteine peptidase [Grosmannia clavigera kw1407]EFX06158.1 otu-like cysteine peptidase [Grosmannia clavigera kw1407]